LNSNLISHNVYSILVYGLGIFTGPLDRYIVPVG